MTPYDNAHLLTNFKTRKTFALPLAQLTIYNSNSDIFSQLTIKMTNCVALLEGEQGAVCLPLVSRECDAKGGGCGWISAP